MLLNQEIRFNNLIQLEENHEFYKPLRVYKTDELREVNLDGCLIVSDFVVDGVNHYAIIFSTEFLSQLYPKEYHFVVQHEVSHLIHGDLNTQPTSMVEYVTREIKADIRAALITNISGREYLDFINKLYSYLDVQSSDRSGQDKLLAKFEYNSRRWLARMIYIRQFVKTTVGFFRRNLQHQQQKLSV